VGWKKMEMRYWVAVRKLPPDSAREFYVDLIYAGAPLAGNILCAYPARAKDEAHFLQADISDRILDNGFTCNKVPANARYRLPAPV
jgi:hypothetical protein